MSHPEYGSQKNYQTSIRVNKTPTESFNAISDVSAWWSTQVEGNTQHVGDLFTVRIGTTFVTFIITEYSQDKKIVWQVTDCDLPWLIDRKEWKATEVVWELAQEGQGTTITLTHMGLIPGVECYEQCETGWNKAVKESLLGLIVEGKRLAEPTGALV